MVSPTSADRDLEIMTPRVSIGLPVYNGERFLQKSVDSILGQTYEDFELIICDNASTDRTEHICRDYVCRDSRVKYFRNTHNVGAAANFCRVFNLSSGQYFKWMADDDMMEPQCLVRCVERLDRDPDVVLVYPKVTVIDEAGEIVGKNIYRYDRIDLRSAETIERFRQMLLYLPTISIIFGMIRSRALRRTSLLRPFVGADFCLLVELVLLGKFDGVGEHLVRGRWHKESYGCKVGQLRRNGDREGREQAQWFDPANKGRLVMPHWMQIWGHFLSIVRSEEKNLIKSLMILFLCRIAIWWRRELAVDVYAAVKRSF